jgi:hypothetical protein
MASGVFGLRKVYKKQVENVDNNNFASWPESGIYGYFFGGAHPAWNSTIDRIDFSSETTSAPGNNFSVPEQKYGLAAVSTGFYGYLGGGYKASSFVSTVDRFDFSNETLSTPGNNLSQQKNLLGVVSNSSYGYFGGGSTPSTVSTVDRIDFSNETTSTPGNDLPSVRSGMGAVSSSSYGYFGGGSTSSPTTRVSTVDRIDFSNETTSTTSTPTNKLSQSRSILAGTSSNSHGYFGGGFAPPAVATVDRIDFSNEIISAPGNDLPESRSGLTATSSNSYGYFAGGTTSPPTNQSATVDRIDFSNETTSAPGNNLTQARRYIGACSGGASVARGNGYKTYGYCGGGSNPGGYKCTISRLDFSTDTINNPGNNLLAEKRNVVSVSSNSYGYFGGGTDFGSGNPSPTQFCNIDRLDFSNETVSNPGNNLPQSKYSMGVLSSNSYGYFAGGRDPFSSIVQRIDFSNETTSDTGETISQEKYGIGGVSNNFYGYFLAGYASLTPYSRIERIDFLTETTSILTPNGIRESDQGISSNNSYAYGGGGIISGGVSRVSTVSKFDFSTENFASPISSNLHVNKDDVAGTSSSSHGYFMGGVQLVSSPPNVFAYHSKIERIDFSNETISAPGNDLPESKSGSTAVSNSN